MNKHEKYRKVKKRLDFISIMIALIVGDGISSYLGISGKGLISLGTALNLVIVVLIASALRIIAIKIADNWYTPNKDK